MGFFRPSKFVYSNIVIIKSLKAKNTHVRIITNGQDRVTATLIMSWWIKQAKKSQLFHLKIVRVRSTTTANETFRVSLSCCGAIIPPGSQIKRTHKAIELLIRMAMATHTILPQDALLLSPCKSPIKLDRRLSGANGVGFMTSPTKQSRDKMQASLSPLQQGITVLPFLVSPAKKKKPAGENGRSSRNTQ